MDPSKGSRLQEECSSSIEVVYIKSEPNGGDEPTYDFPQFKHESSHKAEPGDILETEYPVSVKTKYGGTRYLPCYKMFVKNEIHIDEHDLQNNCNTSYKASDPSIVVSLSSDNNAHKNKEFRYNCKECGKEFHKTGNYKTHLLIHSGLKPHICSECNKEFRTSSNLTRHLLVHSGLKEHKCKKCRAEFSQASQLKYHLVTHSDVKPHKCKVCNSEFKTNRNLKMHLLVHTSQ